MYKRKALRVAGAELAESPTSLLRREKGSLKTFLHPLGGKNGRERENWRRRIKGEEKRRNK